jgi:hypothetical protein
VKSIVFPLMILVVPVARAQGRAQGPAVGLEPGSRYMLEYLR